MESLYHPSSQIYQFAYPLRPTFAKPRVCPRHTGIIGWLLTLLFEMVTVRDQLCSGFYMRVDIPRWELWLSPRRLPLVLLTAAVIITSLCLHPFVP